jgi:chromosome segregation ATPase
LAMKIDPNSSLGSGSPAGLDQLEERIRRVAELCRDLRQERAILQKEVAGLLLQIETISDEKRKLERRIDHLIAGRRELHDRVESMLDAIATLEMEVESGSK